MKATWLVFGLGLLLVSRASADMLPPPPAQFATSQNGTKIVRLSYPKPNDYESPALLTIYAFDSKKDAYLPIRSITADRRDLGQFMFVSDDGRFVILANVSLNRGLRVFAGDAQRKSWPIAELINETEAQACLQTGSTLQWFEQGRFHDGKFYFSGPATGIRTWGSSFTVMRPRDQSVSFSFTVDLATLTLTKTTRAMP